MSARSLFLRAARLSWVGGSVSFLLRHFSKVLPIKRVYEDAEAVAFFHPAPCDQPHILVVPKARARTPFDLSEARFRACVRAGEVAGRRWNVPLQLRINGGARQEVMQAHFHLYPASSVEKMTRVGSYAEALALARGAVGFAIVCLIGAEGIWVDRTGG